MEAQLQAQNSPTLTVDYKDPTVWGRLNDLFKAKIRYCDRSGNLLNDGIQCVAVALDGQMTNENNWSTPFESSNPENKLPTLLGGLQGGTLTDVASAAANEMGIGSNLASALEKAEGRSSFTKVNSTQIFLSNSSTQISMTLVFRAWRNARKEVEEQVAILHQMSVPKELSDGLLQDFIAGEKKNIETFMPSLIPPYVALYYANKAYLPLVIQSFSRDIVGNMTSDGDMVYLEVPVTFLSRQAWDARDVAKLYNIG